jgi:hypothetical protein
LEASKQLPLIVTDVPIGPEVGLNEVMVGAVTMIVMLLLVVVYVVPQLAVLTPVQLTTSPLFGEAV